MGRHICLPRTLQCGHAFCGWRTEIYLVDVERDGGTESGQAPCRNRFWREKGRGGLRVPSVAVDCTCAYSASVNLSYRAIEMDMALVEWCPSNDMSTSSRVN